MRFRPSHAITLPLHLAGPNIVGFLDEFGPERIKGWIWRISEFSTPVSLVIYDGERPIETIEAAAWRRDLEELRQGDGRCGIDAPVPRALLDGASHIVDIRLAEASISLLQNPFEVKLDAAPPIPALEEVSKRHQPAGPIKFSFIVNFYNMKREADRTLRSLSRSYQHDCEDIAYEILCIDNGSKPPLEQDWIETFGPEFRLFHPRKILPSPCAAINEAARAANGEFLAIMIDGAHVLTPGIFREAANAFSEMPEALFAPRQWWFGGDQRWLSSVGYTREMEDVIFARIGWPSDGYALFEAGMPYVESPNSWYDGLAESNCLFLPAALYARIGGMDESFAEPGAGLANLDLFRRAADVVGDRVICPLGEASFHQFHGGMTTNVSDEEKDARVRSYESQYRDLRGEVFKPVSRERVYVRGRIRRNTMHVSRQRPSSPAMIGVTEYVRPGDIPQHFDHGAQAYLQTVYAECQLYRSTVWAGKPVQLAPADLINIQAIIHKHRPEVIVTTSTDEGLIAFLTSMRDLLGLGDLTIIRVLREAQASPNSALVHNIVGDPYHKVTLNAVAGAIGARESVLVLFEPQRDDFLPIGPIQAYARFVSFRSYFVFLGTVLGQPWLGYSRYWFAVAIREFLKKNPAFVADPSPDLQIVSMCAGGFLQRVRTSETGDEAALD